MKSEERLSDEVIEAIRGEIADADGQEVLLVGRVGPEGRINEIVTAARGSDDQVPALYPFMERGDAVIHNHPSGTLKPSGADLAVATSLGNNGIGFFIVDNHVRHVYVVSEPIPDGKARPLDPAECAAPLLPGGALDKTVAFYEYRESQVAMTSMVVDGFNEEGIRLLEAGTGVGKSLAYLIPAVLWALANEERVVISTATINLQQQIIDKDIPLVLRLTGKKLPVLLMKGRGNYLCLRRLEDAVEEEGLFGDHDQELAPIKEWAAATERGDRSELAVYPPDGIWSRVCSESDTCMGLRCRYRERCFVLKLRKEASGARILVVNHHLLFSDLSARIRGVGYDAAAVLPPFSRLVFDEAHSIEDSATSFFSESVSRFSIGRQLSRLWRQKKGRTFGLSVDLQKLGVGSEKEGIPDAVRDVLEQLESLDSITCALLAPPGTHRFVPADKEFPRTVFPAMQELRDRVLRLCGILKTILDGIEETYREEPAYFEAKALFQRLANTAGLCASFIEFEEHPDKVFWVETVKRERGEPFARYTQSPLHISDLMGEAVYAPLRTVICTSATLSVRGDFSYFRGRIGLEDDFDGRVKAAVFPSPFPYRERVLLGIPSDSPDPTDPSFGDFLSSYVGSVLELTEGKGLVLFTSYGMLREVYENVSPRLARVGIPCLKQGDDERSRLLDAFRSDTNSVLFATDSFWEGVDTPGESLSVVIICRLPFRVPTDPVLTARMEEIDRRGGNSFMELSLPDAVTKLKQGFGRLMRRSSDSGVVLILDPRIVRKSYGNIFLSSLPETRMSVKEGERVLADIEDFLYGRGMGR